MTPHKQLRNIVSDQIRADILNGKFKPGEWLRQMHIAEELGVSQMPVREALKELSTEGLVEHIPYRGVRVIEFSPEDIVDLYAHRGFLEGVAAGIAATRITIDELATLRQLQVEMSHNIAPENLNEYRKLNRLFHETIYRASHRPYLIRTLNQIWSTFPTMLWGNFVETATNSLPERDQIDLEEHDALIVALEARDPDKAQQLMRQHIEVVGTQLAATLRQSQSE